MKPSTQYNVKTIHDYSLQSSTHTVSLGMNWYRGPLNMTVLLEIIIGVKWRLVLVQIEI